MTELPECEDGYRWLMEGELVDHSLGDQYFCAGLWEQTTAVNFVVSRIGVYRRPVKQEQEKPMRTAEEAYNEAEKSGVVKAYFMGRPIQFRLTDRPDSAWFTARVGDFINPRWEWRIKPAEITPTIAKWHKIERDPVKAEQGGQPKDAVLLAYPGGCGTGYIYGSSTPTHWAPLPAGPKDGE